MHLRYHLLGRCCCCLHGRAYPPGQGGTQHDLNHCDRMTISRRRCWPRHVIHCVLTIVTATMAIGETMMDDDNTKEGATVCGEAQARCLSNLGCGMALHNYVVHCSQLINGETDECTSRCKSALISLVGAGRDDRASATGGGRGGAGEAFMTCNCQDNEFCSVQKRRVRVCTRDVLREIARVYDDTTPISCSLAELVCAADTSCLTALDYYRRHCVLLLRGESCTARCNNSVAILYRQTMARKLRDCYCDGTEDYDCQTLRCNMRKMCFDQRNWEPRPRIRHPQRHDHTRTRTRPTGRTPVYSDNDVDSVTKSWRTRSCASSAPPLTVAMSLALLLTGLATRGQYWQL